jgi:hypothetical protein
MHVNNTRLVHLSFNEVFSVCSEIRGGRNGGRVEKCMTPRGEVVDAENCRVNCNFMGQI